MNNKSSRDGLKKLAVSNLLLVIAVLSLIWIRGKILNSNRTVMDIKVNIPSRIIKPYSEFMFLLWPEDRQMNVNQIKALDQLANTLKKLNKIPIFVNPENIQLFSLKDDGIQNLFEDLSIATRQQYMKCYIMNFYGGSYIQLLDQYRNNDAYRQAVQSSPFSILEKTFIEKQIEDTSIAEEMFTIIPMSQFTLNMLQIAQKQVKIDLFRQQKTSFQS